HMRGVAIACLALLNQHAYSAALPIEAQEISSVGNPRGVYDTISSTGNSDEAGAAGSSDNSVNLKKRDQIAIIVIASLVVVIGGEPAPSSILSPRFNANKYE